MVDTAEAKASTTFDAQLKKGSDLKEAATAALEAGGAAVAAAACSATGIGAAAAPLCAWLGSKLGPALEEMGSHIAEGISDMFDPKPRPWVTTPCGDSFQLADNSLDIPDQIKREMAKCTPEIIASNKRIDVFLAQAERIDYLCATEFVDALNSVGRAIQNLERIPSDSKILAQFAERLPLVDLKPANGDTTPDLYWWTIPKESRTDPNVVSMSWHVAMRPPSLVEVFHDLLHDQASGAVTREQTESAMLKMIGDAKLWLQTLQIETVRIMVMTLVGGVVNSALTTQVGRDAPHAREPDAKVVAGIRATMAKGIWPANYQVANGITAGVQFLGGGKSLKLSVKV
jgi:hypothetical protein